MKYLITGAGWPVQDHLIPPGTVIDPLGEDQWSRLARGRPPPLNAMPLTWHTWQWMKALHPGESHQIVTPAGAER